MINEPGIIFADEPTGALNKRNTGEVLDLLTELNKEGQSILMVTHDLRAAVRRDHGFFTWEDGKILDELSMPVFPSGKMKGRGRQRSMTGLISSNGNEGFYNGRYNIING